MLIFDAIQAGLGLMQVCSGGSLHNGNSLWVVLGRDHYVAAWPKTEQGRTAPYTFDLRMEYWGIIFLLIGLWL